MSDMGDLGNTDDLRLRVEDIARDATSERVLVVHFSRKPTDYEMHQIHANLRISVNE